MRKCSFFRANECIFAPLVAVWVGVAVELDEISDQMDFKRKGVLQAVYSCSLLNS